jgi:hypothetical protein
MDRFMPAPLIVDVLILSFGRVCRIAQYGFATPICGARTGFAMPKKITTPCPPQRVDSASEAPG